MVAIRVHRWPGSRGRLLRRHKTGRLSTRIYEESRCRIIKSNRRSARSVDFDLRAINASATDVQMNSYLTTHPSRNYRSSAKIKSLAVFSSNLASYLLKSDVYHHISLSMVESHNSCSYLTVTLNHLAGINTRAELHEKYLIHHASLKRYSRRSCSAGWIIRQ